MRPSIFFRWGFSSFLISLLLIGMVGATQDPATQPKDSSSQSTSDNAQRIHLLVMDPLSSRLACACVEGYAQRDYEKFAHTLSKKTGKGVHLVFAESFAEGLKEADGRVDIVIGKHSVVLHGAQAAETKLVPMFQLTDKNDSKEQTGLFVVRANNAAQTLADLKGYRVLFGPADCDEKSLAPRKLLEDNGIEIADPKPEDVCDSCSVAAKELMAASDGDKVVGVISSYAKPLLEGCGNIQKGDLRVVGESAPVPFITVFFHQDLLTTDQTMIKEAFTDVELDADLMTCLETGSGFQPWPTDNSDGQDKADTATDQAGESKKKPSH